MAPHLALAAHASGVDDFVNSYAYDALNRLTRVTQTDQVGGNSLADKRIDFGYLRNGQLATIQRYASLNTSAPVVNTNFTYDARGRLTQIKHGSIVTHGYTYDASDRLTAYTNSAHSGESATYSYDLRGQLTGADRAGGGHDETYAYDDNGNRETVTNSNGTNQDYDTDPNNQLESDGTFTYLYDDEGNRTHRFIDDNDNGLLDSGDDDITEYTWDHRNRLVEVKERAVFGGAVTREIDYAYDAFDRMVKRTVDANGASAGGVTTEYFIYDGQRAVLTLESDGDVLRRHLWADAVDMLLAEEGAVEGLFFHLQDHQGTTRDVVDDDGDLVNHVNFDAFGNIESQTNAGDGYSIVWAGLIWDEPLAMYRAFYRLYDAAVGRWASEDPIDFAGGTTSLSEYVGNAPTMFVDPNGLERQSLGSPSDALVLNQHPLHGIRSCTGSWPDRSNRDYEDGVTMDGLQTTLDVYGLMPVVAEVFDVVNGIIYGMRGKYAEAGLSFISVVPIAGDALGKGGKVVKRINGNSLRYVGETHVYVIRGPNGIHKVGESMQGVRCVDGASIRGEAQARALTRQKGQPYVSEIRKTFPDKASARQYETDLILRFRRMYGKDTLRGNLGNR